MRHITADLMPMPRGHRIVQSGLFFRLVMLGVTSAEFLDAAGGIHEFLLSGKKRVAGRADFNFQFRQNRADFKGAAAGAYCVYGLILGVYIFFHDVSYLHMNYQCFITITF